MPSGVLAQLGNRVQHALRAFTPEDAKALRATVSTFPKSGYDLEQLLTQLGIGEAVVTVLSERGAPTPVAWTRMRAPQSLMGPAEQAKVDGVVAGSPLLAKYRDALDRESAYEKLTAAQQAAEQQAQQAAEQQAQQAEQAQQDAPAPRGGGRAPKEEPGMIEQVVESSAFRSMMRSAGSALGREITRSIFGTTRRRR